MEMCWTVSKQLLPGRPVFYPLCPTPCRNPGRDASCLFYCYPMLDAPSTAWSWNVLYFALSYQLICGWKCTRKQEFASKIFFREWRLQTRPPLWEAATPLLHPLTARPFQPYTPPVLGRKLWCCDVTHFLTAQGGNLNLVFVFDFYIPCLLYMW